MEKEEKKEGITGKHDSAHLCTHQEWTRCENLEVGVGASGSNRVSVWNVESLWESIISCAAG